MGPPTLAGFTAFAIGMLGLTTQQQPAAFWFQTAFTVAMDIVNQVIQQASADLYTLAVYNLATSNLINFALDPQGSPAIQGSNPPSAFFANQRAVYKINSFSAGVVENASDQSTSAGLKVPDWAAGLTIADLQLAKDPYGRRYLGFAQKFGTLWGIT